MKIKLIIASVFLFVSCKSIDSSTNVFNENNEITFYRVTEKSENLFGQDKVEIPKYFSELMFESLPKKLPTSEEITLIEKHYRNVKLNQKSRLKIAEIFKNADFPVNKASLEYSVVCAPVYRDILVFRENGKIIAFAKICLSCYKNYIIVEDKSFENYQIEYEKLHKLLDSLASH
jgi:hypothetical protein